MNPSIKTLLTAALLGVWGFACAQGNQPISEGNPSGSVATAQSARRVDFRPPVAFRGQSLLIPRDNGSQASTTFLTGPYATINAPADGVLIYKGAVTNANGAIDAGGLVLMHGDGLYSVISSPMPWQSTNLMPANGESVAKGQFLGNVNAGALAQSPLTWSLFSPTDARLAGLQNLDPLPALLLKNQQIFKTADEALGAITAGQQLNTKQQMQLGVLTINVGIWSSDGYGFRAIEADSDEAIAQEQLIIKLKDQPTALNQLANTAALLDPGAHDVEISTGRFFKSVQKKSIEVQAGGITIQWIDKGRQGGMYLGKTAFMADAADSDLQQIAQRQRAMGGRQAQGRDRGIADALQALGGPEWLPAPTARISADGNESVRLNQPAQVQQSLAQETAAKEQGIRVAEAKEKDRLTEAARVKEALRVAQETATEEQGIRIAEAKEKDRLAEAARAKEAQRVAQETAAKEQGIRIAEAKEKDRLAEAARVKEALRVAQETAAKEQLIRIAEAKEKDRLAEAARVKEALRVAQETAAKEQLIRIAEAKEKDRLAEEARVKEALRIAQETAAKEQLIRIAEAKEKDRLAAEAAIKEQKRLAEAARLQDIERIAQESRLQEQQRIAKETAARERLAMAAQAREEELAKLRQQIAKLEDARSTETQKTVYASRRALVIGNDSYKQVSKLLNARADATAIADSLRNVGYQVTLKLDLNEKEMKLALRSFKAQIEGGDEVMFFFAGHGVQLGSSNYLLPVDIAGESEEQIKDDSIQLQRVLDDMNERKAKFTLALIDACRDNPFKMASRALGGRGLAPTTAATGQMVIFSAGSGQQALDKMGPADKNKNGLFTRVFLKEMQKTGVSIDRIVRNVRTEVVEMAKSVGHDQVPAIYDQVVGDFYFKK